LSSAQNSGTEDSRRRSYGEGMRRLFEEGMRRSYGEGMRRLFEEGMRRV